MLNPMEATYKITVRNSGDEVLLDDDELKAVVTDYIEENHDGVLAEVTVERLSDNASG